MRYGRCEVARPGARYECPCIMTPAGRKLQRNRHASRVTFRSLISDWRFANADLLNSSVICWWFRCRAVVIRVEALVQTDMIEALLVDSHS